MAPARALAPAMRLHHRIADLAVTASCMQSHMRLATGWQLRRWGQSCSHRFWCQLGWASLGALAQSQVLDALHAPYVHEHILPCVCTPRPGMGLCPELIWSGSRGLHNQGRLVGWVCRHQKHAEEPGGAPPDCICGSRGRRLRIPGSCSAGATPQRSEGWPTRRGRPSDLHRFPPHVSDATVKALNTRIMGAEI